MSRLERMLLALLLFAVGLRVAAYLIEPLITPVVILCSLVFICGTLFRRRG